MSDRMRVLPFEKLVAHILEEHERHGSIFGIPKSMFFRYDDDVVTETVMGAPLQALFGPAAGPHTQLSQNIICSYITGCRFIELKTVQKLDSLEFEKPCIDAFDEGYNTEWSQELSLEESFDEYLKAWFCLHMLARKFALCGPGQLPGFLFNMSVGYDLEGIGSERMDWFINSMTNPLDHDEVREKCRSYGDVIGERAGIPATGSGIPEPAGGLVHSVTISTMHGCPPAEIESMASYLMGEKGLNTYVKLNPTLLGGEDARYILKRCGWTHIEIEDAVFENDLGYEHAVELIRSLQSKAVSLGRNFGVKLSNTLANTNTGDVLPGSERYMSGRPLFPLTVNLAHRLASEFDGRINISYSGGASAANTVDLLRTGIRPVTMTTDMLKPGGYLRFHQVANSVQHAWADGSPPQGNIDVQALRELAENVLSDSRYRRGSGKTHSIKLASKLGMFDCVTAPCMHACPIHQDIPAYIEAVGRGEPGMALSIIMRNNPLPSITGYICDHQCMEKCVRWDYDNPVSIRALKRTAADAAAAAAENAFETVARELAEQARGKKTDVSVAVVGGGPAGLACSFFLAREGVEVTVFERHGKPGGTVAQAIPRFRLPDSVIERDVALMHGLGVKFVTGWKDVLSIHDLKEQGFSYVVLAAGSGMANKLDLPGSTGIDRYYTGIDFLYRVKAGDPPPVGKKVLVIGGGNSAVDAARAAWRLSPGSVRIVYRRDLANMPADREEIDACIEERIVIDELLSPLELVTEQGAVRGLRCARMRLGDVDRSGRRRPIPVPGEELLLEADTVIAAIGEHVETDVLEKNGIRLQDGKTVRVDPETGETGLPGVYAAGDCVRGPATVVEAIADAKAVSRSILKAEGIRHDALNDAMYTTPSLEQIPGNQERRAAVSFFDPVQTTPLHRRKNFDAVIQTLSSENAARESERCLRCSLYCSKCVEVCPNRANVTLYMDQHDREAGTEPAFSQATQILHIDDFCNECGNCETFCPHDGKPYQIKPTLFSGEELFMASENSGFYYKGLQSAGLESPGFGNPGLAYPGIANPGIEEPVHRFVCRLNGHVYDMYIDKNGNRFSPEDAEPGMTGMALIARNMLTAHPYLLT